MPELEYVRLVRNGQSTHVAIPRPLLRYLEWLPGESVVLIPNPDKSLTLIRVRRQDLLDMLRRDAEPAPVAEAQP